ncbi:hypothetical protein JCM8547_006242 [Rhodosporidiobolus lusitaniae]
MPGRPISPESRRTSRSSEHTAAEPHGEEADPDMMEREGDALGRAEKGEMEGREGGEDRDSGREGSRGGPAGDGLGEKGVGGGESAWKDGIVGWDGPDDPTNPKNWSFRRRYLLTALLGGTTMCSTFASSVFSSALPYVAAQYGVSEEVATLGTSLFILGYVVGPIVFAPMSEVYGRKISIYLGVFIFICLSAETATAKDLQTIMVTRFFGGVGASAPPAVVAGALADMFESRERGTAVVFYSLAIVSGPCIGPIIGSAVSSTYLGWRWTMYLTVILSSVVGLLGLLIVPETFAPALLTRKAKKLRFETGRWELHSTHEENDFSFKHFAEKTLTRPLTMLYREPMVLCICLYNSFAYGILYLLFSAVPIVFEQNLGWTPVQGSLPFLAVLVGTLTAGLINYLYSSKVFARYLDKHDNRAPPEMRLPPMMLGGILFPTGFMLLGWASVAGKIVGLGFIGVSFLLIFQSGINYLIDAYTSNAASAVAANTFTRSLFAAALPLVAQPLYHNLGTGFACTLLGCIAAVLAVVPFVFWKVGPKLRGMSKYAKAG